MTAHLKVITDVQFSEIEEQIGARYEMIRLMIGSLYPSIISGEIEVLCDRKRLGPELGQLDTYYKNLELQDAKKKQEEIAARYISLSDKLKELATKIAALQETCKHPYMTKVARSDTGNYCKADDRYWYDMHCPDCKRNWSEPQ